MQLRPIQIFDTTLLRIDQNARTTGRYFSQLTCLRTFKQNQRVKLEDYRCFIH